LPLHSGRWFEVSRPFSRYRAWFHTSGARSPFGTFQIAQQRRQTLPLMEVETICTNSPQVFCKSSQCVEVTGTKVGIRKLVLEIQPIR
jgi:hypothetical protein